MAESTLRVTWSNLEAEVGRYLGLNRTIADWSGNETADVLAIITRGLRNFYFPPRTSPTELAHIWSFLRPTATLIIWDDVLAADAITISTAVYSDPTTLITASGDVFYPSMEEKTLTCDTSGNTYTIDQYVSATQVYVTGDASGDAADTITIDSGDTFTLPWDFGGMAGDGRFCYDNDDSALNWITVCSHSRIRTLRQGDISTGTPWLAAITPMKPAAATQGQRWEATFHQPPNDNFTLHYRYYVLPDALVDDTSEYPYGSAQHGETMLESCLAVAEGREKDRVSTEHQTQYAVLLQASIDRDKQLGEPIQVFGYNADGSDGRSSADYPFDRVYRHNELVTFNGNDGS
jgi:hypothetical protein